MALWTSTLSSTLKRRKPTSSRQTYRPTFMESKLRTYSARYRRSAYLSELPRTSESVNVYETISCPPLPRRNTPRYASSKSLSRLADTKPLIKRAPCRTRSTKPLFTSPHHSHASESAYSRRHVSGGMRKRSETSAQSAPQLHSDPPFAKHHIAMSSPTSKSPIRNTRASCVSSASPLVSRLRRHLESTTNKLGHKPSIMDSILDPMSPFADYADDDLVEIAERSQDLSFLRSREYTFPDRQSLHDYWSDQTIFWSKISPPAAKESMSVTFPYSVERSTLDPGA